MHAIWLFPFGRQGQPSIVIVGAGPSGASTAFHLLEHGVQDVLVLDKASFPRDKLCGGGLTRKAQQELGRMGVYDEVVSEAYHVPKPYIVMPSGTALHARPREDRFTQLLVLNRRIFDEILMRRARERGAEIREGVEVTELIREDDRCVGVRTRDGEVFSAEVIVVAAGARSARLRASTRCRYSRPLPRNRGLPRRRGGYRCRPPPSPAPLQHWRNTSASFCSTAPPAMYA